ncbi:HAMP domain-containing sensor histidine kinase [Phenylobacterium sp.]|uniref:sensor histidine kinase n=1 Tax=Phenylobacterium sp. TaxID=1871053 RepID=UPI00301D58F1
MSLMFRLQSLAIVVAVLSAAFVHLHLGEVIPPARMLAYDVVQASFIGWWIVSIAFERWRGVPDDTPDGWYPHTLQVFWFGNLATVGGFWIAMPYGTPELRLMASLLCVSPVVVEIIGSVRARGRRGFLGTIAPVGIPLGLSAWYLLSDDQQRHAVALFYGTFTAGLLMLREHLQNAVDEAYAAKAEAEAARDGRARFLAAASHDLGQPLQAARLFFDQTVNARSAAQRKAAQMRADWALGAMEQQLRQILDHLKLDARVVRPQVRELSVGSIIARLAELYEPAARLSGVRIVAAPTRLRARGDEALIERALGNLLVNAIRHARARRVLVGARRHGAKVRIWVIDDGRGVPEADRAGLFQEFAQGVWSSGDEVRGGFGLGLASTRRLAELMGGDARHEPCWENGSAFWLELPRGHG